MGIVILIILISLFVPAILVKGGMRYKWIAKTGVVILCYLIGIILGVTLNYFDLTDTSSQNVINDFSSILVVLAIPLLLMTVDTNLWFSRIRKMLIPIAVIFLSIIVVGVIVGVLFNPYLENSSDLASMLAGVYSGGTPNMAAIGKALDIDQSAFVILSTYDALFTSFYLLLFFTVGQSVFSRFLRPYEHTEVKEGLEGIYEKYEEKLSNYLMLGNPKYFKELLMALSIAGIIVFVSVGLSTLFPESFQTAVVICALSALSIVASYFRQVRNLSLSFTLGMYLILCFCLAIGTLIEIEELLNTLPAAMLVLSVLIGITLFQLLICKAFDIDVDHFIIISVATICSPPFVAAASVAIKNRYVLLTGISIGLIGYFVGNYLGILVNYLVESITI